MIYDLTGRNTGEVYFLRYEIYIYIIEEEGCMQIDFEASFELLEQTEWNQYLSEEKLIPL